MALVTSTAVAAVGKEVAKEGLKEVANEGVKEVGMELGFSENKIERTSTFEDQTVDNFKFEEQRSEYEGKLKLGKDHDGDVLRQNMEKVMGTKVNESEAHHVVGNRTPNAAAKLEKFGIDRNDPANGIYLPDSEYSPLKGSIHKGNHCQEYYDTVERRMSQANTREEALEVLQSLKEDLFSGDLPLQNNKQFNK